MSVVNRFQYFLNSEQASVKIPGTPYCEFLLKKQLTLENVQNVFEVSINKVNLPYSFYQWSTNNNRMTYTVFWGANSNTGSFVITPGNYNLVSLITEINTQLTPSLVFATSSFVTQATLEYVYNSNSNKVKIRLTGTPSSAWSIVFDSSELLGALGFDTLTLIAGGFYSLPVRTVNVNPIMNVYIVSQTFLDTSSFQALNGQVDISSIIAIIPIVHSPLFYQPYDFPIPLKIRLTNETISAFDFDIIDSKGRTLVFDQPWSLQFTIEELDVGDNNSFGNQFLTAPNIAIDPIQQLKNQILSESLQEVQSETNVQERSQDNQTVSRKRSLAPKSSERNDTNSSETDGSRAKRQTAEKTSDLGPGRGSEKV